MKINKARQSELSDKLNTIASNVAKKPVFVVAPSEGCYNVLNYFNKAAVIEHIPSKHLAKYVCESLNANKRSGRFKEIQNFVNMYAKHYYDCEFYKHTIKTTKDEFKKDVTITRLDMSIEYLKQAATNIRKSC